MKIWSIVFILIAGNLSAVDLRVSAIEFPPYTTTTRKDYGLSFELLTEAFRGSKYKIVPIIKPPIRTGNEITNYHISLYSIPGLKGYNNFEQQHLYNIFYTFYFNSDYGQIVWNSLDDLKGLTYGELRVSLGENYIGDKLNSAGLIKIESNSLKHLFTMLKKGRIDLILCVDLTVKDTIDRFYPGDKSIRQTDKLFLILPAGPWFNLKNPEAVEALKYYKKGITRMKQDGTFFTILEKYYGEEVTKASLY